jgi:hypothetical protein
MQLTHDTIDTTETESNEMDVERSLITDTVDTISDSTDNFKEADVTDNIAASRPVTPTTNDIIHFIKQHLLSLDPLTTMALGSLEYRHNFHPQYIPPEKDGNFGKTLYRKCESPLADDEEVDADELGLVFFGEICSSLYGTAISAKGNHYAGNPENPKVRNNHFRHLPEIKMTFFQPITDNSIVKDVIVLRPLTIAPTESLIDLAFKNQCAGLEEILDEDARDRSLHPNTSSVSYYYCFSFKPNLHRDRLRLT